MKIDILSPEDHPVRTRLVDWVKRQSTSGHNASIYNDKEDLRGGDILFLISCSQLIAADIRSRYKHTLVIHGSDLPKGKGWSPQVWGVLEGKSEIVVSLFEAVDKVDAGRIWKKESYILEGHELYDELNDRFFTVTLSLMDFAIANADTIKPHEQDPSQESFYKKRTPEDSRIDPEKTVAAQFNLLRVCDPNRFPAFFDYAGHRYRIVIEKIDSNA